MRLVTSSSSCCCVYRASAISAEQTAQLNALVDAGNPQLRGIFRRYETDKDVYALIDALKAPDLVAAGVAAATRQQQQQQQPATQVRGVSLTQTDRQLG